MSKKNSRWTCHCSSFSSFSLVRRLEVRNFQAHFSGRKKNANFHSVFLSFEIIRTLRARTRTLTCPYCCWSGRIDFRLARQPVFSICYQLCLCRSTSNCFVSFVAKSSAMSGPDSPPCSGRLRDNKRY